MVRLDLVEIDDARFDEACRLFFLWKDLNSSLKSTTTRGINFPEAISEQIGCYALDFLWNKGSYGDARTREGLVVEMKATSNFDRDLTSFSPSEEFDLLVFLRLDYTYNMLYVYNTGINSRSLANINVNSRQTVKMQQEQGRRPRLSVIKSIIEPLNLEPTVIVDIRKGKIVS